MKTQTKKATLTRLELAQTLRSLRRSTAQFRSDDPYLRGLAAGYRLAAQFLRYKIGIVRRHGH